MYIKLDKIRYDLFFEEEKPSIFVTSFGTLKWHEVI